MSDFITGSRCRNSVVCIVYPKSQDACICTYPGITCLFHHLVYRFQWYYPFMARIAWRLGAHVLLKMWLHYAYCLLYALHTPYSVADKGIVTWMRLRRITFVLAQVSIESCLRTMERNIWQVSLLCKSPLFGWVKSQSTTLISCSILKQSKGQTMALKTVPHPTADPALTEFPKEGPKAACTIYTYSTIQCFEHDHSPGIAIVEWHDVDRTCIMPHPPSPGSPYIKVQYGNRTWWQRLLPRVVLSNRLLSRTDAYRMDRAFETFYYVYAQKRICSIQDIHYA